MGTDREEYQAAIGGTFITRNVKGHIWRQKCDINRSHASVWRFAQYCPGALGSVLSTVLAPCPCGMLLLSLCPKRLLALSCGSALHAVPTTSPGHFSSLWLLFW